LTGSGPLKQHFAEYKHWLADTLKHDKKSFRLRSDFNLIGKYCTFNKREPCPPSQHTFFLYSHYSSPGISCGSGVESKMSFTWLTTFCDQNSFGNSMRHHNYLLPFKPLPSFRHAQMYCPFYKPHVGHGYNNYTYEIR
jgi:hypothetical protein